MSADADRHARLRALFDEACELPAAERAEFLDSTCAGDEELRVELSELLAFDEAERAPMGSHGDVGSESLTFFGQASRPAIEPPPGIRAGMTVDDFRLEGLIGQGGMGQVWRARQLSLGGRRVAVKFVRSERVTPRQLAYFQREARAGGRLQHPGIVSVHGYGEDAGLAWIAMELVEGGWTLRDSIDTLAREDRVPEGYDRQVARLVAEIADALQAAHDAGVIHRDLKPQNILITPRDEAKVTDFGIARIIDETSLSQTGDLAGTYTYMSPEQVTARRSGVDHRTDVFSLGVILYEMLALQRPFRGDTSHQVAAQIVTKDPPDPRTFRSRIPRDLVVIVGRALEKDRDRRYQTMTELGADLRRFLMDEPIRARPPTRWERGLKWTRRNPAKSGIGAVTAVAFLSISLLLAENVRTNRSLDQEVTSVLRLSALQDLEDLLAESDDLERMWPPFPEKVPAYRAWIDRAHELVDTLPIHRRRRDELRVLARPRTAEERRREREAHPDFAQLIELEEEIARRRRALVRRREGAPVGPSEEPAPSGPVDPRSLTARAEVFFGEGRDDEAVDAAYAALDLAGAQDSEEVERYYEELEARIASATSAAGLAQEEEDLAALQRVHEELAAEVDLRRDWQFTEQEQDARWWHNQLAKLIEGLEGIADEATGLLAMQGNSPEHGRSIPWRLARAQELAEGFAPGSEYDLRWQAALPELAEVYPDLKLTARMGLVPIGSDPDSGLWEFWHVLSGEEPMRDPDGRLQPTDETGLVLVLLRGGVFLMGSQRDPDRPNYDPATNKDEGPVHAVELSPFFLSKFEMTQGQWTWATGSNPSRWSPLEGSSGLTLRNPVETVTWNECRLALHRMGLELPSEAQWEYACRAGTSTVFSCPTSELAAHANLADLSWARTFGFTANFQEWIDGFGVHAPVGSFAPNAFGLHDVHGNVWEWCLDGYEPDFYGRSPRIDPCAMKPSAELRVCRGGGFSDRPVFERSADRVASPPSHGAVEFGLRPAMVVAE